MDINSSRLYASFALTDYEFVGHKDLHFTTGLKMTVAPHFLVGGSCTELTDVFLQGYLLPNQ